MSDMTFIQELDKVLSVGYTENGDIGYNTTVSAVLDFFSSISSYRTQSEDAVIRAFTVAYAENPTLSLKALFYMRDVRGGQGERRAFRVVTQYLATTSPDILRPYLKYIPEYGRWDDLIALIESPLRRDVSAIIRKQLLEDKGSDHPSLLAKWIPSENASSSNSRRLSWIIMKELGFTSPRQYRKLLSHIRAKIRIVETQMSKKSWGSIEYSAVPSKAMTNYRKAFQRHDSARFSEFLDKVKTGETKINSSTLYPYEILEKSSIGLWKDCYSYDPVLDAQWNALEPKILDQNAIVIADVSGSMNGRPLDVAISLAMFFAERNVGIFNDVFMTFTTRPQLVKLQKGTFADRANSIQRMAWAGSTDLRAAFDAILKTAVDGHANQDEMPARLYIISDMQFNGTCTCDKSTYNYAKDAFAAHGYTIPEVVFWNVGHYNTKPVYGNEKGVQLVSGFSQSLFSQICGGLSPYDMMIKILMSDRYKEIGEV